MPKVQQTFSIIPELGPRARSNAPPPPPMTSKQVKKAYRERTKQPRISKAEQRRLELAEQERIRKELEKEKQASRARAARERKKAKDEANKEARRKSGRPLVDVRPSQDTISRFVRGKKRDAEGKEVAKKAAPLAAVVEETDTNTERETDIEVMDLLDDDDDDDGDDEDEPSLANMANGNKRDVVQPDFLDRAPRNSQRSSQRLRQSYDDPFSSPKQKRRRLASNTRSLQQNEPCRISKRSSQTSLNNGVDEGKRPRSENQTTEAISPSPDADSVPVFEESHENDSLELAMLEDENIRVRTEGSRSQENPPEQCAHEFIPPSGQLQCEDSHSSSQRQSQRSSRAPRSLKRFESFKMDPDDLVDDDSLLQLDSLFATNELATEKTVPQNDEFPPLKPDSGSKRKEELQPAKEDSQSSLDFDLLENMNVIFDEMTTCEPQAKITEVTIENIGKRGLDNPPPRQAGATTNRTLNDVRDSFEDDGLDDGTLLVLGQSELKDANQDESYGRKQAKPTTQHSRKPQRPVTTYEKDLGLVPETPPRKSFVPLSTQSILSGLDDFFPSSSQQARELEDLPEPPQMKTPCLPAISEDEPWIQEEEEEEEDSAAQEQEPAAQGAESQSSSPPQFQKRFFTSSGSNEVFSLAIQRSRRTAAREEIQRKDQQRREAGLREQARKQAAARAQACQRQTYQKPQPQSFQPQRQQPQRHQLQNRPPPLLKKPILARPLAHQAQTKALNTPPIELRKQPNNPQPVRKPAEALAKPPLQRKETMISNDKENSTHKLGLNNNNQKQHNVPMASQESEYGGEWIDDAWTDDLMM